MTTVDRSDIDILLELLLSEKRWLRAKAIHYLEGQWGDPESRKAILLILKKLEDSDTRHLEDVNGLMSVLNEYLANLREGQSSSVAR